MCLTPSAVGCTCTSPIQLVRLGLGHQNSQKLVKLVVHLLLVMDYCQFATYVLALCGILFLDL